MEAVTETYCYMQTTGLDTTLFEHPDFQEVFRSLPVKICVTKTEPDPKHPTRPIIYFFGEMRQPSTSTMTGRINMTDENQIQWHFVRLILHEATVCSYLNCCRSLEI